MGLSLNSQEMLQVEAFAQYFGCSSPIYCVTHSLVFISLLK